MNTPSSDPSELRVVVNCTGARVRSVPGVSVLNRGIIISPPPPSADDDDDDDDAIANDDSGRVLLTRMWNSQMTKMGK